MLRVHSRRSNLPERGVRTLAPQSKFRAIPIPNSRNLIQIPKFPVSPKFPIPWEFRIWKKMVAASNSQIPGNLPTKFDQI